MIISVHWEKNVPAQKPTQFALSGVDKVGKHSNNKTQRERDLLTFHVEIILLPLIIIIIHFLPRLTPHWAEQVCEIGKCPADPYTKNEHSN